jgi:hydroxymethylbilane synthase
MRTVFISRAQGSDSLFRGILEAAGWQVTGKSLVQLTPLSVSNVPQADWWFFSSQNAVRLFLPGRNLPPLVRMGALGPSTAEEIERQTGHTPDFVGNGDPGATAKAFITVAKKQKVVFPGAVNSMQSVQSFLDGQVDGYSLHVYDNTPIDAPPDMRDMRVLVFTSPLNAVTYLSKFSLQEGQRVVAIGDSTAKALRDAGVLKVKVAEAPNEKSLAEVVLSFLAG